MDFIKSIVEIGQKGAVYLSLITLGKKIKENEILQKKLEKSQKNLQIASLPRLSWSELLDWLRSKRK